MRFQIRRFRQPFIIGAFLIPISGAALASGGGDGYSHHSGDHSKHFTRMIDKMADKLDLNDVQQKELDDITEYIKSYSPERSEFDEQSKAELLDIVGAEFFDRGAFTQKWQVMRDERSQAMQDRVQFMDGLESEIADFLASLDPEQRAQLVERMGKASKRGHYRHHGDDDDREEDHDKDDDKDDD